MARRGPQVIQHMDAEGVARLHTVLASLPQSSIFLTSQAYGAPPARPPVRPPRLRLAVASPALRWAQARRRGCLTGWTSS